jgi:hypothetical protein
MARVLAMKRFGAGKQAFVFTVISVAPSLHGSPAQLSDMNPRTSFS